MNLKKLLSLAAATAIAAGSFAAMAVTASAASVDDLTTISSNATFIAQDETTAALTKDTLSWGGKLLTLNGDNGYSTAKGYSVFNGDQVQNLLQVKQGRNMAVKVSGACTIDVYHDDNGGRIVQAGSTNKGTDYAVTQAVRLNETTNKNYDIDTITVPAAGVVYIGASGDVYVAAIDVKFAGDTPEATETPDPTATPEATATPDPTPTPTPIPTPEIQQIPLDTAITFADDGYKTYIEMASEAAVNTNNVSYGDNSYTHRLYFAGAIGSSHPDRYVTFTPAEDGILEVVAQGGSNERYLAIKQGESEEQTNLTTADPALYTYTVKAGVPVMMYSKGSGIGVYSIKLVAATVEPETNTLKYAFTKTLDELNGSIKVTVKGTDTYGDFTSESTIEKGTHFSGEGTAMLGIVLDVPDGMTVTSVTIE